MGVGIPKQAKRERDQITIRLDRDVIQNLEHYCQYLESGRDYVINPHIAFIFRKDKPFAMWMANRGIGESPATNSAKAHPASPKPAKRQSRPSTIQGRLSIGPEASK